MKRPSPPEDVEIQPADPVARKRALWTFVAVAIVAGMMALAVRNEDIDFEQWLGDHAAELIGQPGLLLLAAFVLALPLVGIAVYVHRAASRVVKAERIPLPGQKVIKDTPIITGKKAIQQGRAMQVVAVIMGIIGLILPFALALLVMMMQQEI